MYINELIAQWENECGTYLDSPVWADAAAAGVAWEEAMRSSALIEKALLRLTPYGRTMLKLLLKHGGLAAVEEERLLNAGMAEGMLSGLEAKAGIRELHEAGLLIAVAKLWGDRLLFVPKDSFPLLIRHYVGKQTVEPMSELGDGFRVSGQSCRPLSRRFLYAFAELARTGTALTGKGALPRKQVMKLDRLLGLDSASLEAMELKVSASGKEYPQSVALLLDAAIRFGLLRKLERSLEWSLEGLETWLLLDAEDRELRLFGWLNAELLGDKPHLAGIAAMAQGMERGGWHSARQLLHAFAEAMNGPVTETVAHQLGGWLRVMQQCGWLELGEGQDDAFFRWTLAAGIRTGRPFVSRNENRNETDATTPEAGSYGLIQLNGEVILFPDCPYALRWEMEAAAELVSDDSIALYRITADTVRRAVRSGRGAEHLTLMLEAVSGARKAPAEFMAWMDDIVRQATLVSLQEALLLQCADARTADELAAEPSVSPWLGARLGERYFLVEKGNAAKLSALLEKAGYEPLGELGLEGRPANKAAYPIVPLKREPAGTAEVMPTRSGYATASEEGFLIRSHRLSAYKLVRVNRDNRQPLLPEAADVPSMWLNQLRHYHLSTRRDMMERAVAWQAPVQLKLKEGLKSFVPEKVEQAADGWAVRGLLREGDSAHAVRLTPDMWNEMKLMVPESNI